MAHSLSVDVVKATEGVEIKLPLPESITGQTLADFAEVLVVNDGLYVANPETDLGLALDEVDSINAPGFYIVRITPDRTGTLYVHLRHSSHDFDYTIQVSESEAVSDPSLEGEFTITVNDGTDPVQGAVVRIFEAGGTLLVTRGTTDALGELTVSLPIGTYQYRVFKDGYDATDVNPTIFVVQPNDDVSPVISELVPDTASIGDVIAVQGGFFADAADAEVEFGAEATVAADFVSGDRKVLLVTVPTLTGTIIPIRVSKPDPANLPSGKLYSNTLTLVRV
jgi:hypothetical protein